MYKSIKQIPPIPNWIIWVQAICFSVLYAIWALPETILIRHVCLITGALLSLWSIYQYRNFFFQRRAIPVWLIVTLFGWATFHLFFLSNDYAAQHEEYTSIWKRTAIGAIFALGLGIALANNSLSNRSQKMLWALIYLGLLAPALIYIVKYVLTFYGASHGWIVPDYWRLYYSSLPYYIPKTSYVCFCLPTLGIALGQLAHNIQRGQLSKFSNLLFLGTIPVILFVFYGDNIKNGVIYSVILLTIFISILLFHHFYERWVGKTLVLGIVLAIGVVFVAQSIQSNTSWATFSADVKIAIDTQTYQHWKYNGEKGYPNSELGSSVSVTNYERIAWGKTGVKLIKENPLGYGLIERSFGHLAKRNWPDSKLHQSHSGWIDLTLGLGVPGLLLLLTALLILLFQLARLQNQLIPMLWNYQIAVWWALFSLGIMWCTTEISQKVYFDNLIFWLSLGAGVTLINLPIKKALR